MGYQKIISFLDNKPNQTTKFWTKNWFKINDVHVQCITLIAKLNLKI